MAQTKTLFRTGGEGRSIALGILIAVAAMLLGSGLTALFITLKDTSQLMLTVIIHLLLFVSSFFGGWFGGKKNGKYGLKIGIIIGGILFLSLSIAGIITSGMNFTPYAILKAAVILIGTSMGGIAGSNHALKRKYK